MEIEDRYVYEVYKEKSFSKAAQKLFITQPALSIAIKKVETKIGMPIFIRKKYPLRLTNAGKIYIESLKKIMLIEKQAYSEISDIENLTRGEIIIGATNYMNAFILAPIIKKFKELYPNIRLVLLENSSPKSINLLKDDVIEITFSCGDLEERDFDLKHVFTDEVLLSVPREMLKDELKEFALTLDDIKNKNYDKKRINLEQFYNLPYIVLGPNNNLHDRAYKMLKTKENKIDITMNVDQLITAHSFCINGIGATFIGSYILPREYSEEVFYFSIDSDYTKRKFNAVRKHSTYESFAIKEFIKLMREYYL